MSDPIDDVAQECPILTPQMVAAAKIAAEVMEFLQGRPLTILDMVAIGSMILNVSIVQAAEALTLHGLGVPDTLPCAHAACEVLMIACNTVWGTPKVDKEALYATLKLDQVH